MVGKRQAGSVANAIGATEFKYKNGDVESRGNRGTRSRPFAFKDAVNSVMGDHHRDEIKRKLIDSVDRGSLENYRKSKEEIKSIKSKKVRQFYEEQNERLNDWLEVDSLVKALADDILDSMDPDPDDDGHREHGAGLQAVGGGVEPFLPQEEQEARRKGKRNARRAININVIANIILLAAKGFAALKSSSLSLIASLVDSALDLLCTMIVWTTNKLVGWRLESLQRNFPVGRRRLEPLGIVVFSIIMVIAFLQILRESVEKLLPSAEHKAVNLPPAAIGAMLGTVGLKGIIGLGCMRIKTTQVQALAQDCKTDVIFNTLTILFPLIGYHFDIWWLDPVGAGLLSLFIIYDWAGTCFENITRLSGSAVDVRLQKKLTFLAWRFAPVVNGFKNIIAYHAGDGVWAEMDILLDEKEPLARAHDVAETLQYCCEGLNEVDRAFVTIDYSSAGPTGHAADGA